MASPVSCCNSCPDTEVVEIPGIQGLAGTNGADGTDGVNAYTTTTANFVIPAIGGPVPVSVLDNSWMAIGQTVYAGDVLGDGGTFEVASKTGTTLVGLTFLGADGDSAPFATVDSGAIVSPAGRISGLAAALPAAVNYAALTTAGAVDNLAVAAGAGEYVVAFYFVLAQITSATLLTFTPTHKFKIKSIAYSVEVISTTNADKTITPYIAGGIVTGGALQLTHTVCGTKGNSVAGSAITAANSGTALQNITLVGSGPTAFTEGSGWVFLRLQNMDTADAIASISDHINDLITSLT